MGSGVPRRPNRRRQRSRRGAKQWRSRQAGRAERRAAGIGARDSAGAGAARGGRDQVAAEVSAGAAPFPAPGAAPSRAVRPGSVAALRGVGIGAGRRAPRGQGRHRALWRHCACRHQHGGGAGPGLNPCTRLTSKSTLRGFRGKGGADAPAAAPVFFGDRRKSCVGCVGLAVRRADCPPLVEVTHQALILAVILGLCATGWAFGGGMHHLLNPAQSSSDRPGESALYLDPNVNHLQGELVQRFAPYSG